MANGYVWLFFYWYRNAGQCPKIVYSEPDRDDSRRMDFEIAGKIGGNFLLYKNTRNKVWISVLDNDMKQLAKVEQEYVPDNDRVINVDFFPYNDFCYMIYQYQKKMWCIVWPPKLALMEIKSGTS